MLHLMNYMETVKLEHAQELKRAERARLARQLDTGSPVLASVLVKLGILLSATGARMQRYAGKPAQPSAPRINC